MISEIQNEFTTRSLSFSRSSDPLPKKSKGEIPVTDKIKPNNSEVLSTVLECVDELLPAFSEGEAKEKLSEAISEKLDTLNRHNDILRKLQLEELEILKSFDKICRKHNLRYYIVGGTLIGAVRHKGFIPWDDDIDVSMPRKDFNKFLKIAKEELPSDLFLQNQKTEKKCYFFYAKLRKNGTYFPEEKFEHTSMHKGIFIDIFPLDYVPSSKVLQKLLFKAMSMLTGFICSKEKTTEFLYKNMSLPFIVGMRIIQCILPKFFLMWMRNLLSKVANLLSNKKQVASLSGFHGYPQEVAPTEFWGEGTDILFEGFTAKAPSKYHELLTHMFADYMTLPPEEERVNHNLDFDKVIFEGCTPEDYKPKFRRKRSHRYYGCDYDILPNKE